MATVDVTAGLIQFLLFFVCFLKTTASRVGLTWTEAYWLGCHISQKAHVWREKLYFLLRFDSCACREEMGSKPRFLLLLCLKGKGWWRWRLQCRWRGEIDDAGRAVSVWWRARWWRAEGLWSRQWSYGFVLCFKQSRERAMGEDDAGAASNVWLDLNASDGRPCSRLRCQVCRFSHCCSIFIFFLSQILSFGLLLLRSFFSFSLGFWEDEEEGSGWWAWWGFEWLGCSSANGFL